ncbi:MAG: glucan biosynthesis protein [Rhodomicrobiaceae bacterium]
MDRRTFLMIAGLGGFAALMRDGGPAFADPAGPGTADFSWDGLRERAKSLAAQPYAPPGDKVAEELAKLDYDAYRKIKFRPDKAIWSDRPLPFRLQLFHAGYLYREPVEIHLVENGKAARIAFDPAMFDYGPAETRVVPEGDVGFAGFRVHAPDGRSRYWEEFVVFQGASYFRAHARGQNYGLSARGLAINTAQPGGEEFPAFRAFWVETPEPDAKTVTIHALLDSRSVTGAYRFDISIGKETVMDVECLLYPRRAMTYAGIAPFSSMFYFGPADHTFHDDFRPRVHDSDGLLMHTGRGEWIWRPLVTAGPILYSVFSDRSPRGFGLMQRERDFEQYQDLVAAYEKRPGSWVEPLSDWGEGSVDLIELPTDSEYVDNIVAFWRPKDPLEAGKSYEYRYRLSWCDEVPVERNVAHVVHTRTGKGLAKGSRYFLVDFAGGPLHARANDEHWDYKVSASAGEIRAFSVAPNPEIDGKRVGIEYHPEDGKTADLSFQIRRFDEALTEKWVYRWAP